MRLTSDFDSASSLLSKQAVVVLRKDLGYPTIPPEANKSTSGLTSGTVNGALQEPEWTCSAQFLQKINVFIALRRDMNKGDNIRGQASGLRASHDVRPSVSSWVRGTEP